MIPVVIPTLCRAEHLRKCIGSLLNNVGVELVHLYLFVDSPLNEKHKAGYKEVLDYIESQRFLFKQFGKCSIIYRDYNYGAYSNAIEAMKEVFQSYDRLIFSEDDNIFSPNFIIYMKLCLAKMEFDENVFAVNGYLYPIGKLDIHNGNAFLYQGFSAWGCGLWKVKFEKLTCNKTAVIDFVSDVMNVRKINKHNPLLYRGLLLMISSDDFFLDAYVDMYLIATNGKCVFPVASKVRNIGHDGSGVHCTTDSFDVFASQRIDDERCFSLTLNEGYRAVEIKRYFALSNKSKLKNYYLWLTVMINFFKWR